MVRSGALQVGHEYPDRGHGGFAVVAPPDGVRTDMPVEAGRWLRPDDTDALVLTRSARVGELAAARIALALIGLLTAMVGVHLAISGLPDLSSWNPHSR